MFTFDLCPRFLIANEKLVKLLIDSSVTRYIEFKKISRLLTATTVPQTDDKTNSKESNVEIVEVPCTRNDIFISNIISPIEKRYLMSFLEKCYRLERHGDWYREFSDKPFSEFLKTQTLTEKLQEFITNTLLMQSQQIQTENALNKINFFLRSFGHHSYFHCMVLKI
ncbi:GDP dissociation inhibitor-like protein [Euroglyphus maynei]|uniref:GDP dissociation inhibitor-like protein n=1 Tax=Euroglyphus maynei TaxID=6958 RepID=A0A1Y3B0B1_EURMA|nr:GDP dissociation inhibitor-like protein [Euroglyphus maynei]